MSDEMTIELSSDCFGEHQLAAFQACQRERWRVDENGLGYVRFTVEQVEAELYKMMDLRKFVNELVGNIHDSIGKRVQVTTDEGELQLDELIEHLFETGVLVSTRPIEAELTP